MEQLRSARPPSGIQPQLAQPLSLEPGTSRRISGILWTLELTPVFTPAFPVLAAAHGAIPWLSFRGAVTKGING